MTRAAGVGKQWPVVPKKRWGCVKMAKNMFVWGNVGKDMWKNSGK